MNASHVATRAALRVVIALIALIAHGPGSAGAATAADLFRGVYLSEVQPEPKGRGTANVPNVPNGLQPGWVEIAYGGEYPINLSGWFLTDDRTNLTKWRFPQVVLVPGKFLVIQASGRDQSTNLLDLHANILLQPGGGYLALVGRQTNVVSEFGPGYPALRSGTSFGRVRGEPALTVAFERPTPGKPNASAGRGFAPAVAIDRPSATFTEPFQLTLSVAPAAVSSPAGAVPVIRYTLDGSMPSGHSPAYTGPLAITNSTHLRVRAHQEGLAPGPPASAVYLQLSTPAKGFSSTLPLLVLDTFGRNTPVSGRTTVAHLLVHEPVQGRASLTNPPTLATRASYRVRGSTSADMPQSGFAVELVDEFDAERSEAMLGLPADSDWVLYAPNAYDPVLFHNPFVHQLSRDLGRYSPRTRFVEMFVVHSAGGIRAAHYHGLHVLEEKIKIGRHRVNIDRLDADDVSPPEVTGGYLLKIDRLGPDEGGAHYVGDRPVVYVEPKEQTMLLPQRAAQRRYLNRYLRDFERALDSPDWKDPEKGYRAYLDVDAAIDFHVLEVLSGNVDSLVLSTYWYKPRGGRIVFGPHWDFDRALGSTDGRDEDPRVWNTGQFFTAPWWDRLFADPDFWQHWVDRWQELRRVHFALTNLTRLADALAAEIREAQPRQYQRWDFRPRGGSYDAEVDHMKAWLASRLDFIDGQLVQPPRWSVTSSPGRTSHVSFQVPTNVTVWMTFDGSDPRLPEGGVSSNAVIYTGPVAMPLPASVPAPSGVPGTITARARHPGQRQRGGPPRSTPWSGPVTLRAGREW